MFSFSFSVWLTYRPRGRCKVGNQCRRMLLWFCFPSFNCQPRFSSVANLDFKSSFQGRTTHLILSSFCFTSLFNLFHHFHKLCIFHNAKKRGNWKTSAPAWRPWTIFRLPTTIYWLFVFHLRHNRTLPHTSRKSSTKSTTQHGIASSAETSDLTWLTRRATSSISTWDRWPFSCSRAVNSLIAHPHTFNTQKQHTFGWSVKYHQILFCCLHNFFNRFTFLSSDFPDFLALDLTNNER